MFGVDAVIVVVAVLAAGVVAVVVVVAVLAVFAFVVVVAVLGILAARMLRRVPLPWGPPWGPPSPDLSALRESVARCDPERIQRRSQAKGIF